MMQALKYHGSSNLGDCIMTIALLRLLLEPVKLVYRDTMDATDDLLIINGFLGKNRVARELENVLFAGIHLADPANIPWIRQSRYRVGARDPWTQAILKSEGIDSKLIGCATLTFPRYEGPRYGVYGVDVPCPDKYCQSFSHARDGTWTWQVQEAQRLLDLYRTAELVVTSRLHCALPCLAYGTPVIIRRGEASRFSLLDAMGVRYDEPVTMDIEPWANRYRAFLSDALSGVPA